MFYHKYLIGLITDLITAAASLKQARINFVRNMARYEPFERMYFGFVPEMLLATVFEFRNNMPG